MKKVLSIFLATVLLLSSINLTAVASEGDWASAADTSWYNDSDTSFTLSTAAELAGLAQLVNSGNSFSGKTILLDADINLENKAWEPIGTSSNNFQGTFDGQDKVISNLSVIKEGQSNIGLFGMTTNGEIKNLTVENAIVTGRLNVGTVSGTPYTSRYTNIKVTGHVEVNGMAYVGGVLGKNAYANLTGITVDVDDTSYVNANSVENGTSYRTYVGGVVGFMGEGSHVVSDITSNIDVYGSTCDIGGIAGIAHYGNTFKNITCTGNVYMEDANETEIGGIAGVWHNQSGYTVTFENCVFEGTAYIADVETEVTISGPAYGSGTGTLKTPVAKIDTSFFYTFAEALTAAAAMNDAVTITLLDNIEWETGSAHGSTPFVPAESSSVVTIDGNDFTITATGAGVGSIRAANGTLLTFNNVNFVDESVSYAEGAWEFTYLEFAGKLKFTSCDFKDEIQIDSDNGSSPITESEFTNCTFESNESSIYAVWFGNGSAKFDTCTFTGYRGLKMHEAYGSDINAVTVENCTFNNITEKPAIAIGDLNALTEVNIKNCTVTNAQAGDQNAYLLESDTTVDTFTFVAQNNTITVDGIIVNPAAKIGNNEYPTIESAIAVSVTNDIIDIFNNTTISDTDAATLAGKSVTIDTNEKVLTINSATDYGNIIYVPNNHKLDKTSVSDSDGNVTAYKYSVSKILVASPLGVVGGGGVVTASEFTVTFNANGGSKVNSIKVKKGEAATAPANPEKEGYTFDGWYADRNLKNAFDFKTEITKNITLYAKWAEVKEDKTDTEKETTDNSKNKIVLTIGDVNINVFGNDIKNDVAPKIVNNRTMLPARLIAESLGATVTWTAAEPNKVLIEKGDTVIIITIGSDTATVNGEEIKLDSPAFIENDRTYIATRFLSEKLGATVEWIGETAQVIITKTE